MIDITLKIVKSDVYKEVAKVTSYTAKMADGDTYDKIYTKDEDVVLLDGFWNETKGSLIDNVKRFLKEEGEENGEYSLQLSLPNSFDTNLKDSVQDSLFSFFSLNIVYKWCAYTNKDEVQGYATEAASHMDDINRKLYFKTRPQRPNSKE